MTSRTLKPLRAPVRSLLVLGLLGLVALGAGLINIHFAADFEAARATSPGSQTSFTAQVGGFSVVGDTDLFSVVSAGDGGELDIGPNTGSNAVALDADLSPDADDVTVDIKFDLRALVSFDELALRVADENETGMIDMVFSREGQLRFGGKTEDLPGDVGDEFSVALRITDPAWAVPMATVVVTGPQGAISIKHAVPLAEAAIHRVSFRRPAGTAGSWRVDDLFVTSLNSSPWKAWSWALDLTD